MVERSAGRNSKSLEESKGALHFAKTSNDDDASEFANPDFMRQMMEASSQ